MRYVIFGAGAIGGLVGARLHQSGHEVLLIARGAHHDAIARDGLTMLNPGERETFKIAVAPNAADAGLRDGDVILLCVKTQDSAAALLDIRDAAPDGGLPIVCLQNAVVNEPLALRLFPEVYGSVLLVPAEHLQAGVVAGYGGKLSGVIDLGRYPRGVDQRTTEICAALSASHFDAEPRANIMVNKYAKLLSNLANGVEVICGPGQRSGPNADLINLIREEGRSVLGAAGIEFAAGGTEDLDRRWEGIGLAPVEGQDHRGGSGWQSVMRGAGTVETDYLNGEIVLLGRQFGVPAPINETVQYLSRLTVTKGYQPGWMTPGQVLTHADGRSSASAP